MSLLKTDQDKYNTKTHSPLHAEENQAISTLLEKISRITGIINNKNYNFQSRLDKILRIILSYIGADHGSIMLREKKYLVVRAATRPEILGHKQPLDDTSISGWVEKSGKPLFVENISNESRFKSCGHGIYRNNELLSVPILLDNKVAGVINVTDKTAPHAVLQDDIACLLQFSRMILALLTQQQMHDELKRKKNMLRQKNKALRLQEAKQAELSRLLIHDLKGPLSEVVANLDIMSYSIPEAAREYLEAAQTGCDRAVRMVSNLVTVGKIEDGKIFLLKETISPVLLIEESLSSVRGLASLKQIELLQDIGGNFPLIDVDRVLVLRVMQNLLHNALGCVRQNTSITVGCLLQEDNRSIEFFVEDQGPGISPEKQRVIFDKYSSLSCLDDGLVGTGLGLYFCMLAVQEHGGKLGVSSDGKNGSRFYFNIPI